MLLILEHKSVNGTVPLILLLNDYMLSYADSIVGEVLVEKSDEASYILYILANKKKARAAAHNFNFISTNTLFKLPNT